FQAEDGIRDRNVTGVQTCALPILAKIAFPVIGSAIFAIVIGILLNNFIEIPKKYRAGIQFSSKKVLHYSIIVLGFTLTFQSIGRSEERRVENDCRCGWWQGE